MIDNARLHVDTERRRPASTGRRSGLCNLEERATALGGAVRLESNQPHGTVLELRAPLDTTPS